MNSYRLREQPAGRTQRSPGIAKHVAYLLSFEVLLINLKQPHYPAQSEHR